MNFLQAINQCDIIRVKELLALGKTNVNITDNHNFSALHHAVVKKNYEICQLLLEHEKFDSTVRSYEGCTALMIGLMANVSYEIVELLVTKKPSLVAIKNNEEVPPLHEAIKTRRLELVRLLLEHGASVNDFDLDLENCLHLAASNSDYEMIEFLLNETEVDPRAKNRDDMNPLCLLLVRSRNENQDLVAQCFFLMLEHTYDKSLMTGTYAISDIFQCAFLACVYSHTEVVKYLIHNVYSVNNSNYEFIRKLSEHCDDDNAEFLYYVLVFLHDDIDQYEKFSFPRFPEINYYMCIRSAIYIIEMLLDGDDAVELIIKVLDHMERIGFNIRVKEFVDQFGVLLHSKYSTKPFNQNDLQKMHGIFAHLMIKNFKLNLIVRSYLHSIAIARDSELINIDSSVALIKILIQYATTFFRDLEIWNPINDFKNLNPKITQIVNWLVKNFGNYQLNVLLDTQAVFTLKQLCRNRVREQIKCSPAVLCNQNALLNLGLPEILTKYVAFRE